MKYKSIIQNSILVLSSCFLTLGVQTSSTHEADSPTYTNKTTVTRITAKDLNNNQPLLMSTLIYYAITHISDGRWIEVPILTVAGRSKKQLLTAVYTISSGQISESRMKASILNPIGLKLMVTLLFITVL